MSDGKNGGGDDFNASDRIRNHRNRAGVLDIHSSTSRSSTGGGRGQRGNYDQVNRRDDESIDDSGSEVGWNSDEDHAVGTSAPKKKTGKKHKTSSKRGSSSKAAASSHSSDDSDNSDESDNYSDDDGEGILLSDMLLQNISKQQAKSNEKKLAAKVVEEKRRPVTATSSASSLIKSLQDGILEEDEAEDDNDDDDDDEDDDDDNDDDDDEDEDDEDDEDDNDDGDDDDEDGEDDGSQDEEEEGGDLEAVHERLLAAIDKFAKTNNNTAVAAGSSRIVSQAVEESRFSALLDGDKSTTTTASTKDKNNSSSGGNNAAVSMEALLGALQDVQGLSAVKQHLSDLERGLAAPKHVEPVHAQRAERDFTYQQTAADMQKWQDTVVANRAVKTLDLALDKRQRPSCKSLINRFTPSTAMEQEIHMVLVKNNCATDEAVQQQEESELEQRNFSAQELRERQAELAKVRALMFYEQMKRHRLNKIKSKAYRKIQKRKKARIGEAADAAEAAAVAAAEDGEAAAERAEKNALSRVRERMNLRHKNTSKWSRMALKHAHTDDGLKEAYHDSVRLGNELSQRIDEAAEDDHSNNNSSDDDSEEGNEQHTMSARATHAVYGMISEQEEAQEKSTREAASGKFHKLYAMDFMKKAAQQQRELAREEAQNVLKEIRDLERDADSDDAAASAAVSGLSRHAKTPAAALSKEEKMRASEEVAVLMGTNQRTTRSSSNSSNSGMLVSKAAVKRKLTAVDEDSATVTDDDGNYFTESNSQQQQLGFGSFNDATSAAAAAEEVYTGDNPWINPQTISGKSSGLRGKSNSAAVVSNIFGSGSAAAAANFTTYAQALSTDESQLAPKSSFTAAVSTAVSTNTSAAADHITTTASANRISASSSGSKGSDKQQQVVAPVSKKQQKRNAKAAAANAIAPPITAVTSQPKKNKDPISHSPTPTAATKTTTTAATVTTSATTNTTTATTAVAKKELLSSSSKSQAELVRLAFAGPDLEADFAAFKQQEIDAELGVNEKKMNVLKQVKAGWGDWAGPGAMLVSDRILQKRDRLLSSIQSEHEKKKMSRSDAKKPKVLISERRIKTASKFKINEIPHPFKTREEYERSLLMPIGDEWNSSVIVKRNVMPAVKTRAGRVIEPIKLSKKRQRTDDTTAATTYNATSATTAAAAAGTQQQRHVKRKTAATR